MHVTTTIEVVYRYAILFVFSAVATAAFVIAEASMPFLELNGNGDDGDDKFDDEEVKDGRDEEPFDPEVHVLGEAGA